MKEHEKRFLLWVMIIIGVLLRLTDISVPDLATDEIQAALGTSPAWPPLGMMILRLAQSLFGEYLFVLRGVSFVFGIATLPLIYRLSRLYTNRDTSLLITAIAAIFPSHILFSKLAYLSVQQCFAWVLLLYCFLRAKKCHAEESRECGMSRSAKWLIAFFFASVYATLLKPQGGLVPGLLLLGLIVEKKKKVFTEDLFWVTGFSLIPITLYVLTHPGIAATILLYGGNLYGISEFVTRLMTTLHTWWSVLTLFLIAIVLSLKMLKKLEWPFLVTLCVGTFIGFFLGPNHAYYTTHFVLFSIPIGMKVAELKPKLQLLSMLILLSTTLFTFGPRTIFKTPFLYPLYQSVGFWNVYAEDINEVLKGEEQVTVLGFAGHHLRWYLTPELLVGRNIIPPYPTRYILVLGLEAIRMYPVEGSVVAVFEDAAIVEQ
jgi:4-amino-4-deoxy-L-arabinose transferase-like glycosyltransferase